MKQSFLPRVESLRGLAALSVVGYHVCSQMADGSASNWLDWFAYRTLGSVSNGMGAVVTFFVLSGFVLARSLDANPGPLRFFRNRLFRLLPAAMAVVILLTALHLQFRYYVRYEASFDPVTVILNLLMIRSDINGVMWSMTVECAATPLILFSVFVVRGYGERLLLGIITVLVVLSSWPAYAQLLGGFTNLAPLYAFIVGVLIHFRGVLMPPVKRWPVVAAIIAITAFCYCGSRTQSALVLFLECSSAATAIALIVYLPTMRFFEPLDYRPVRFYGRISYSLYLLHPIGISLAFEFLNPIAMNKSGMPLCLTVIVAAIASIVITTSAAYLSWRFIEIPAIRFGRTFGEAPAILKEI